MDISSATARVASDLSKTLAILSDTSVRRSAVDREDLNHAGNRKKGYIFFNWDSLHARLNSHYEVWSCTKKHTGNLLRKNLQLKDVC